MACCSSFGKKIIKQIDKAEVLSAQAVDSHALGVIPVTKISGGAKTLLLVLNEPEKIFNVSTCGNNCAPLLLEIADTLKTDVTVICLDTVRLSKLFLYIDKLISGACRITVDSLNIKLALRFLLVLCVTEYILERLILFFCKSFY